MKRGGTEAVGLAGDALDPSSSVPLYRQVRALLEEQLGRGVYGTSRPLPSTRFLAGVLGVSRNTVALAYQELTGLGVVESRPRSGLFAVPAAVGPRGPSADVDAEGGGRPDWVARIAANDARGAMSAPRAPGYPNWRDFEFPFISSQPEISSFPVAAWRRALNEALAGPNLAYSIRDAADEDDPLLVSALCREILPSRGVRAEPDQVLVTSGAQQAVSLIADVLIAPGSVVAVENPGYADAWQSFQRRGAVVAPVQTDRWGAVIERAPRFDAIHLTPSHHHPTNATLSLPRRRLLLDQLAATDSFAIEDDYDSEFRFRGRPTPSLKSMDSAGRVLYVGSFSKFLASGLRLGFVVGDRDVVSALRAERHFRAKHLPGQLQRALGLFIASGEYHKVLRAQRRRLKANWEALESAVVDLLPRAEQHPAYPPGGVSLWYTAPEGISCAQWAEDATRAGVLLSDGRRYFLPGTGTDSYLRIGFGAVRTAQIRPGIERLAAALP